MRTDKLGNVIGERPGLESKSVILVAAHLDTVFPAGTDVRVKRDGKRLMAPGISDNGAGLAALAGVARALSESRMRTTKTDCFGGRCWRRRRRQLARNSIAGEYLRLAAGGGDRGGWAVIRAHHNAGHCLAAL